MDRKFSKLRFKEFAKAAAVGGALALQSVSAIAVPATGTGTGVFTINAGNAVWHVNNNITFATTSSDWGFSNATLHTASGTRINAYAGALSWHVNPSPPGNLSIGGYVSPGGTIDISPNFPTVPAVGTTLTGATQVMSGLNVTGQAYFSPVKAVVRSILIMQNPTAAGISVTVSNDTYMKSGTNTFYQATSSGDAVFDATDNWTVSSQTATPTIASDPILTFAYQNASAAVRATPSQNPVNGSGHLYLFYNVTIPAGQTRRVMMFSQLSDTVAHAEADAPLFNTNVSLQGTDYLSGLTSTEEGEIVNWNFDTIFRDGFDGTGL